MKVVRHGVNQSPREPRRGRSGHLDSPRRRRYLRHVRCDECGVMPDEPAKGWRAMLVDLADDPDPPEVIVFCGECVAREFGSAAGRASGIHTETDSRPP